MATIFLSHSSKDNELAETLVAWLTANGFDDLFVDYKHIRVGDKWAEALRAAQASCRVVLFLVTPSWLASDECWGEFMASWYAGRRLMALFALPPSALDEVQQHRLDKVRREDQGADLTAAGAPEALALDAHPSVAEPLKAGLRAAGALARAGLDPYAFEIDRQAKPDPFPGLDSFGDTDADAAVFFGRGPDIAQCLEDLREMRAMGDRRAYAIQGASGSGKSSLLRAGILPRLRRERGWLALRTFRPGTDPLFNFAEALSRTLEGYGQHAASGEIRDLLFAAWTRGQDLRGQLDAVVSPLRQHAGRPDATVLIAMDQGEELARAQGESAEALGAYLKAALPGDGQAQALDYLVAFTVRSDSFHDLQQSHVFEGIRVRTADVRTLATFRVGSAIEQPAARYGVEVENGLAEQMVGDAPGADHLPLLAFAMQRLWGRYAAGGRIEKAQYVSLGKLSGIIADAAERALRGIDPSATQSALAGKLSSARERQAARLFVPAFAQLNDRGAVVRRVAKLSAFDEDDIALIESFAQWRLVVVSAETAEVAHEAMFREWPRFQDWLEPERVRLAALHGLESAAANWDSKGRHPDDLIHRGKRLAEVNALAQTREYRIELERDPVTQAYLAACRAIQRRRRLNAALATVAGLVLLAGAGGYLEFARSREQTMGQAEMAREAAAAAVEQARQAAIAAAASYRAQSPVLASPAAAIPLKNGAVFRDCPECPEMVVLAGGRYLMGSAASDPDRAVDEAPQHSVLVRRFAVGRYAITYDEWAACVAGGGCAGDRNPDDRGWGRGRRPVVDLSWNDVQDYVSWLSRRTGGAYRLLSESEWEYAARAQLGVQPFWTGKTITELQANFNATRNMTEPVGSYPANPLGLYDMTGNAWQWVQDCYNITYDGAPSDGSAWTAGDCTKRVIRGGSWYDAARMLRSANRDAYSVSLRLANTSFRVARDLSAQPR